GAHVFGPQRVVLVSPVLVDITIAHRAISAFHANGAEVDVAEEHAHHQHRGGMDHVCDLHVAAQVLQAGNQLVEHQTRADHQRTEPEHTEPENHLLARVEAVRRHFLPAEHAATL